MLENIWWYIWFIGKRNENIAYTLQTPGTVLKTAIPSPGPFDKSDYDTIYTKNILVYPSIIQLKEAISDGNQFESTNIPIGKEIVDILHGSNGADNKCDDVTLENFKNELVTPSYEKNVHFENIATHSLYCITNL